MGNFTKMEQSLHNSQEESGEKELKTETLMKSEVLEEKVKEEENPKKEEKVMGECILGIKRMSLQSFCLEPLLE